MMRHYRKIVSMRFEPGLGPALKLECGHEEYEWDATTCEDHVHCKRCNSSQTWYLGWWNGPVIN
jgi:hypothetical protein